jgi:hypothetical protein
MSFGPPLFLRPGLHHNDANFSRFDPKPASGSDPLRTLAIGVLGELSPDFLASLRVTERHPCALACPAGA